MKRKNIIKRLCWTLLIVFVLMNIIAIFHAYKFTHFINNSIAQTKSPDKLSALAKIQALCFGVNNPRPANKTIPSTAFETILLQSNVKTECWYVHNSSSPDTSKGTIIICHGYGGEKSSMLDKAAIFNNIGYNTFLVDFMGSGGSEGNVTTIGYKEAEQVKTAYEFIKNKEHKKIFLFGTSMGAVAIMKAINDYDINPAGIILECPFGSMYQTVCARFKNMNAPTFPMAGLLVFWGGIENGFWAFSHNPTQYAKNINCPTLLMYGEKDKNVSRQEIDNIFNNIPSQKILRTYLQAGHENYLKKYQPEWTSDVKAFLLEK